MWTNGSETAGDGIDNDGNGLIDDMVGYDAYGNDGDPMDLQGHGTHCAGTMNASSLAPTISCSEPSVMDPTSRSGLSWLTS